MAHREQTPPTIIWRQPDGQPVSCYDKIAVLNQNLNELRQESQDVLEDALLMGCDEAQVRNVLEDIARKLENPFKKQSS